MRIVLLFLIVYIAVSSNAQVVSTGDMPQIKPIKKTVLDSARVEVYYDYAFRPDSTKSDKWTHGQTLLLVGDRFTGFADYFRLMQDSLNDAYYRERRQPMELMMKVMPLMHQRAYMSPLAVSKDGNTATVQLLGIITYEYTQHLQPIAWTLVEGDSVIAGVHCKKALCRMGGRDWVAWYSGDYGLPFGPYLFRGLPGLIFAISDTGRNHVFTLNGLQTLARLKPIYLYSNKDIIRTSRQNAFVGKRNEYEDRDKAFAMKGRHVTHENGERLPAQPYNPIELE